MKNIVLLPFCIIMLLLTSCSKEDDIDYTANPVYGTWETRLSTGEYWIYQFTNDYKLYRGFRKEGEKPYTSFEYNYTIEGNKIILKVKDSPYWLFNIETTEEGDKEIKRLIIDTGFSKYSFYPIDF